MNTDIRSISLECGHTALFDYRYTPALGTRVHCYKCDGMRTRVPSGWSFRCTRCKYGRNVGEAPLTVSTRASGHAARTGHVVNVWHSSSPDDVQTVGINREVLTDVAPF